MGKFKLLLLSTFLFGQLAFACGSTISGGAGYSWQGNASSPCPSDTNSSAYPGGSAPVGGMNFGPGYYEAMAAKAAAEKKAAQIGPCIAAAQTRNNDNYDDVSERLAVQSGDCQREFSHVPEAMAACVKQANGHFEENSKGLAAQLEVDKEWCIKTYGS